MIETESLAEQTLTVRMRLLRARKPPVATTGLPWNNKRRFLWPLADMLRALKINEIDSLMKRLQEIESDLREQIISSGMSATLEHDNQDCIERFESAINEMPGALIGEAVDNRILRAMGAVDPLCTLEELLHEVRTFREALEDEIKQRSFLYVPSKNEAYFEQDYLFGEEVSTKFYNTSVDIKEAGNCFALELYTACVFHLMRVLEHGLKALAVYVGVPPSQTDWGHIIEAIEDEIEKMGGIKKTEWPSEKWPDKAETLNFCSKAAIQFRYFKNAWRNYAMHAQEEYGATEAEQIMEHVRVFMKELSERLSEPTTPANE
ncbi:MAG TPA: HEPN domain-containing protein [Terriglobia bacterium]|jgi:HEPN domain-containing protein|nr:HEPN domain-containing protein [Terriglobia bacterium]